MKYILFFYLLMGFFIYFLLVNYKILEGYESNMNDNSNENSDYSKTVDLPLTFPFSCKNFCGPGNTCAITGEQCSDDYDCQGCENDERVSATGSSCTTNADIGLFRQRHGTSSSSTCSASTLVECHVTKEGEREKWR